MAEFPKLTVWTDALIADTTHLSATEFGAYMLLLIAAWRSPDCSLPDDDQLLGRITRDPKHWHRVKPVVMAFWTLGEDGRWRQKRLTREREYAANKRKKLSEAGSLGAEKRWGATTNGTDPGPDLTPGTGTKSGPGKSSISLETHELGMANGVAPIPNPHSESPIGDSSLESAQSAPNLPKGNGHAKRKDAGTRLSPDSQPGSEYIAFAESLGLDAGPVWEEFRDFWVAVPGARGRKLDWLATWRNRCRYITQKRGTTDQRGRAGSGPPSVVAAFGRVLTRGKG
jgi:uncharacterized protein YdaU (DUF1376 family)